MYHALVLRPIWGISSPKEIFSRGVTFVIFVILRNWLMRINYILSLKRFSSLRCELTGGTLTLFWILPRYLAGKIEPAKSAPVKSNALDWKNRLAIFMITAHYLVRLSQIWSISKVKKNSLVNKMLLSFFPNMCYYIFLKLKMDFLIKSGKNKS